MQEKERKDYTTERKKIKMCLCKKQKEQNNSKEK